MLEYPRGQPSFFIILIREAIAPVRHDLSQSSSPYGLIGKGVDIQFFPVFLYPVHQILGSSLFRSGTHIRNDNLYIAILIAFEGYVYRVSGAGAMFDSVIDELVCHELDPEGPPGRDFHILLDERSDELPDSGRM